MKLAIRIFLSVTLPIGFICLLIWGAVSLVDSKPTPRDYPLKPAAALGAGVHYAAEQFVLRAIATPSTAKFSSRVTDSDTGYRAKGTNTWECFGHLDAQNVFGAMIREDWFAIVELRDGEYHPVYVRVGDKELGTRPVE